MKNWKLHPSPVKKVDYVIFDESKEEIVCEFPKSKNADSNSKLVIEVPNLINLLNKFINLDYTNQESISELKLEAKKVINRIF